LKAQAEADRLDVSAAADSEKAKAANEHADNYMLAVVLFSSSLFFAGISTRIASTRPRVAILALGCVLFLGTLAWLATLPIGNTM
jgi:hypothetical protein